MKRIFLFICVCVEVLVLNAQSIGSFQNPKVNLTKDTLRVLDIGNSFTNDAVSMLKEIVKSSGIKADDISVYKAARGGASFKTWLDVWNDADMAISYEVTKVVGIDQPVTGACEPGNGERFRSALTECQWDLIIVHQLSNYASDFGLWEGEDECGYLQEFLSLIRKYQPNAAIGTMLIHASNKQSKGDTQTLFTQIASATQAFAEKYGIDFIIPYGTAIENLRSSDLNTTVYNFSRDNHHLAHGVARYTASCTYFQTIFAPRYGVSVLGNGLRCEAYRKGVDARYLDECMDIDDSTAVVAQMAAVYAVQSIYDITEMKGRSGVVPTRAEQGEKSCYSLSGGKASDHDQCFVRDHRVVMVR